MTADVRPGNQPVKTEEAELKEFCSLGLHLFNVCPGEQRVTQIK